MNITLGADPEFFLRSKKTGKIVSAHNMVPGNKVNPYKMKSGGAIQADGTAVEFNIPASSSPKEFADNIQAALDDIYNDFVDKNHFEFAFVPSVTYSEKYWDELPEEVKLLGCEPDFNAWSLNVLEPNDHSGSLPKRTRTGSGHLHVGYTHFDNPFDVDFNLECRDVVKAMDKDLGSCEHVWCSDTTRPKSYGYRGTYRPKKYGVEYRTLSNSWLKYPKLWPWIFSTVQNTFNNLEKNGGYNITHSSQNQITILNRKDSFNIMYYVYDASLLKYTREAVPKDFQSK